MKISHIADSHFQLKRLDECVRCFAFIVDCLKKEKPDYIFHAGDLFEKNVLINSPEYIASVNAMMSLANIAPVFMVRGNHDPINALDIFQKLETEFPINYYDTIYTEVEKDFNLFAIPFQPPSKIGSGDSVDEIHKSGAEFIRGKIKEFISVRMDIPNFILAHISVMNSQFANSEKIQNGEVIMPVEDFDNESLHGVFLGHIHRSQQDIFKDKRIRYAGAHYRTRFDEVMEPGFYMWEFKEKVPDIKFIEIPARDMIQINLGEEDTKRLIANGSFDFPEGSDIKLVLEVPQGLNKIVNTDRIKKMAPENTNLDISIKVNPVVEVRSKKMSDGLTDTQKLEEWGRVSNVDLTSSIKKKLDEIIGYGEGLR